MKGVQCYELFGGIAPKIHTFSFSFHSPDRPPLDSNPLSTDYEARALANASQSACYNYSIS